MGTFFGLSPFHSGMNRLPPMVHDPKAEIPRLGHGRPPGGSSSPDDRQADADAAKARSEDSDHGRLFFLLFFEGGKPESLSFFMFLSFGGALR